MSEKLPPDLWRLCMQFLSRCARNACLKTCRSQYDMANHPAAWKDSPVLVINMTNNQSKTYRDHLHECVSTYVKPKGLAELHSPKHLVWFPNSWRCPEQQLSPEQIAKQEWLYASTVKFSLDYEPSLHLSNQDNTTHLRIMQMLRALSSSTQRRRKCLENVNLSFSTAHVSSDKLLQILSTDFICTELIIGDITFEPRAPFPPDVRQCIVQCGSQSNSLRSLCCSDIQLAISCLATHVSLEEIFVYSIQCDSSETVTQIQNLLIASNEHSIMKEVELDLCLLCTTDETLAKSCRSLIQGARIQVTCRGSRNILSMFKT